ncbi:DEAD/DEAH box helicase [Nocardiopsis coralliicola]
MVTDGGSARVLHWCWSEGALWVWGEDAAAGSPDGGGHPFALSAGALGRMTHGAGTATTAEVLLPGTAEMPTASPALAAPEPAPTLEYRTWRVPARRVPATDAGPVIRAAARGSTGPEARHLAAVEEFARSLARRGCFLPALSRDTAGGLSTVSWRPVLRGDDAAHRTALADALPAAARALSPGTPPAALVDDVLSALLDAAVRAAAGPRAGEEALHRSGVRPDAPAAGRLDAWHRAAAGGGRTRLVLRLVEPERTAEGSAAGGSETWRVEFWAAAPDDPSLQLPLEHLWSGASGGRLPSDAAETLLADLERAARAFPPIRDALRDLAPSAVELGTGGAYAFLRDAAPRLDTAGFAVVLPQGMDAARLGLRLVLREQDPAPAPSSGGGISPSDLVDFSFSAVLGGAELDEGELAELARLKQPLVRLRGRWVEVDQGHVRAALEFLRRRGSGAMRRDEALRAALSGAGAPAPVDAVDADGALGALLDGAPDLRLAPLADPPGFAGELRPYQRRGAAWLRLLGRLGLGAVLADDMGLGKTVQMLAVLCDERAGGGAPGPTLMVCPVSLVGTWVREAEKFAPKLRVHTHHGPDRAHGNALARAAGGADLVVTTYGVLQRDAEMLAALPWHRVVCDEAQAIKNSGTQQARAVRSLPAQERIALTGTPVENDLGELWSVLEFANPGLLGPKAPFLRGAAQIERAVAEGDAAAADPLKRATGPLVLRRLKTDRRIIADLPEKQEMLTWCTLTPEQASLYRAAVDELSEQLDEQQKNAGGGGAGQADRMARKGLVLAAMARLKQICNHPAQFLGDGSPLPGRSGKLERLEQLLQEVAERGERALCFTQYSALGDRLAPYLAERLGCEVLWLHGGTPRARREEMVRHFQSGAPGRAMVFLLSLKAAGTGLTLTAANHVVHIDRWWNPAVEDQATDRAFRIGQRRDVQVRKLVCAGTLEERIDAMIERKKALAQTVVGTGEDWLTELSTEELRTAVQLGPEAVVQ